MNIEKLITRLEGILEKEELRSTPTTGFTGKLIIHCKDGIPLAIEHSFTEKI